MITDKLTLLQASEISYNFYKAILQYKKYQNSLTSVFLMFKRRISILKSLKIWILIEEAYFKLKLILIKWKILIQHKKKIQVLIFRNRFIHYIMLDHSFIDFTHNPWKYYFIFYWSGMIVFDPGCQLAGHTTPCLSACWKAFIILNVSSGFLPTCSSLIVIDLIFPFVSITNNPRTVAPYNPSVSSSTKT